MNLKKFYRENFDSHIETIQKSAEALEEAVLVLGSLASNCIANGGTVFWCGNGGSAADSQHLAAELVGRFKKDRPALRSVALTTDSSVITCVANDYSYDEIFARQIDALGRPEDVLIAISTSGNSPNIVRALDAARKMELVACSLLGKDGGAAKDRSDHFVIVPSNSTARIQETHILIGHILCDLIERELGFA